VQANKVEKQLQMMFHIDLLPNTSLWVRGEEEMLLGPGMPEGVRSAEEKSNERHNMAQRIMV